MKSRRGATLVELLAVMSGCTVILSLSAALIHRAMHTQVETRHFFEGERTALRLVEQFREDVHRATAATANDGTGDQAALLRFQLPEGETVEYRRGEAKVERLASRPGKSVWRDEFRISPFAVVTVREDGDPRRLMLSIAGDSDGMSIDAAARGDGKQYTALRQSPASLEVMAVLNRDRQSATSTPDAEHAK